MKSLACTAWKLEIKVYSVIFKFDNCRPPVALIQLILNSLHVCIYTEPRVCLGNYVKIMKKNILFN